MLGHFNNSIQRFQNEYDDKKKAVLEDIFFIKQDNERLIKKVFETDTLKDRAKERIKQNEEEIPALEAEIARIDGVKDRFVVKTDNNLDESILELRNKAAKPEEVKLG